MPQIFHRAFNTLALVGIYSAVFLVAGLAYAATVLVRSPYVTNMGITREQPIPFSHAHHVNELGIDCRYCHNSAEESAHAGVPPTKTCMNCHSQIWVGADMLAPVRESYATNKPIQWTRVHKIGEFSYFNHSVHIKKGMSCAVCHGRIDHMHLVRQQNTLLMEWCLDCHRNPEKYVRPRDQIYNMDFKPQDAIHPETGQPFKDQAELGAYYVKEYQIRTKESCNACHR
ncbi:MAG: cytochrome c3 family protein [Gemmataceae bacterium]